MIDTPRREAQPVQTRLSAVAGVRFDRTSTAMGRRWLAATLFSYCLITGPLLTLP
jgi:hypothetical protein